MKKIKVAITSAGAGPGIAAIKALKRQEVLSTEIIAMDMDITAPGLYLADDYVIVPAVSDDRFLDFIIQSCRDKKIDFLIPVFDTETPVFARNRELLKEKAGVNVLVNDYGVIITCNEKKNHTSTV